MLKTETRDVCGITLTTTQLPVFRALALSTVLAQYAGPALATLLPTLFTRGLGGLINDAGGAEKLGEALGTVFQRLDPNAAQEIVKRILVCTVANVDGRRVELTDQPRIDATFPGLKSLLGACAFALEIIYSDFTDGAPNVPTTDAPNPGARSA